MGPLSTGEKSKAINSNMTAIMSKKHQSKESREESSEKSESELVSERVRSVCEAVQKFISLR